MYLIGLQAEAALLYLVKSLLRLRAVWLREEGKMQELCQGFNQHLVSGQVRHKIEKPPGHKASQQMLVKDRRQDIQTEATISRMRDKRSMIAMVSNQLMTTISEQTHRTTSLISLRLISQITNL